MKRLIRPIAVLMLLGFATCGAYIGCSNKESAPNYKNVRGMTVAGLFYPRSPEDLSKQVDGFLADAKAVPIERLRALICPHAGYDYSGKTAGIGFKQLTGRNYRTVIVMGPSHRAAFKGAMIPDFDAYETPLGNVHVSPVATEIVKLKPFSANPECKVERPDFWHQVPKTLPPFGADTPDTWEHSIEVELPFLQKSLEKFQFVPIIFGDVEPAEVANSLMDYLDDETLLVASSDLSHYLPYAEAELRDRTCVEAICDLTDQRISPSEACGFGPIATIIEIAHKKGWKAKLLDYRNSGDTAGEKRAVVGYAAIAFYEPADKAAAGRSGGAAAKAEFAPKEREYLLKLARESLEAAVTGKAPPKPAESELNDKIKANRATFVTLTIDGQLRGCIGSLMPVEPLYLDVIHRAAAAALDDPRFKPVQEEELKKIEVEVSVLSVPRQLMFKSPQDLLDKLKPGVHGVILVVRNRQATFLPQVWEQIPDKEDFLGQLSKKAGLSETSWKDPDTAVFVYHDEAFKEAEK